MKYPKRKKWKNVKLSSTETSPLYKDHKLTQRKRKMTKKGVYRKIINRLIVIDT